MSTFDLYIHGTPNGHQIWGSEKNHDYISTFYNHDTIITAQSAMQIDICMGDSYYTYIRQQNVYDSSERPGSFFAITVCFNKTYCTNVFRLHQIFEAVYSQVCIGNLISQKQSKEVYLISDFESSRSGNSTTVERISAIFKKNIGELIEPYLLPLGSVGDTFNKDKKKFSILEVDSPLFFDTFKNQSIIVLPNLEPAIITNQKIEKQLGSAIAHKKELETVNAKLQSDNIALTNENKSLSNQLHASASSSERKYSATINQLKTDLKAVTQERNELKAKIDEAKSSVDLIDKPVQQLTRLLAGRFPEKNKSNYEDDNKNPQRHSSKNSTPIWHKRINNILLVVILICVISILALTINLTIKKPSGLYSCGQSDNKEIVDTDSASYKHSDKEQVVANNTKDADSVEVYDDETKCYIDISGELTTSNDEKYLAPGKSYSLSIKISRQRTSAKVPTGTWSVIIEEGKPTINKQNTFTVPSDASGKKLLIKYTTSKGWTKSRTIRVK